MNILARFTLVLFAFLAVIPALHAQLTADQYEYYSESVRLIDAGEYDAAIEKLREAQLNYPGISVFRYEEAYALVYSEKLDDAREILEEIYDAEDAEATYYQLLGNIYDWQKDPEKAIKTYKAGLERFPTSGFLYLELGTMAMIAEEVNEAVTYWEQGIYYDPQFPSNFFRAATIYMRTTMPGWGVLYGELYRNMDPSSPRSSAISQMMLQAYRRAITVHRMEGTNKDSMSVKLWGDFSMGFDPETKIMTAPFEMFYEFSFMPGTAAIAFDDTTVTIAGLTKARELQVQEWFNRGNDKKFPCSLMDRQKQLMDEGLFEAYNYWLFGQEEGVEGFIEESSTWMKAHEQELLAFAKWIGNNPMPTDPETALSRIRMKPAPFLDGLGDGQPDEGAE